MTECGAEGEAFYYWALLSGSPRSEEGYLPTFVESYSRLLFLFSREIPAVVVKGALPVQGSQR